MTSSKKMLRIGGSMVIASALTALPALWTAAAGLAPGEERGRQIFLHGTAASGKEIVAVLDGGATRINAAAFPCVSCHGEDGRGKSEGGVAAPDITWENLTKPYRVSRLDGRSRPPYTEATLKRAITMGIDAGGKPLDAAMPRFALSYEDAADLVVFLKKLSQLSEPGVSETSIRIGVVLPQAARLPTMHAAVQKAISAYFDNINQLGGIYGRRIDLVFTDVPSADAEGAAAFQEWIERESVFALTGSFLGGAEKTLAPVLDKTRIPMIAIFTLNPDLDAPLNPYVFYLDAGLRGEVDELIGLARKQFPAGARATVVLAPYDLTRRFSENIKKTLRSAGWKVGEIKAEAGGCGAEGSSIPDVVFWLVPQFSPSVLQDCATAMGGNAEFLLPGSFATREIMTLSAALDHKVFATIPKPAKTVAGSLPESGAWPAADSGEEAAAASGRMLVMALQQAGHDVTRQKLMEAIENFYELDVGLGFSVTFGPNRRVGGVAHELVTIDLRKRVVAPLAEENQPFKLP